MDILEWQKVFFAMIFNPTLDPRADVTLQFSGKSLRLTDAKALYDASRGQTPGLGLSGRCTGIEVSVLNERMAAAGMSWHWLSTLQQFGDGLTKIATRHILAERLREGRRRLDFDPDFVAG